MTLRYIGMDMSKVTYRPKAIRVLLSSAVPKLGIAAGYSI